MKQIESLTAHVFTARNTLVLEHVYLARRAALWGKARLPGTAEYDDLYQNAVIGVIEAAAAFDKDRGVLFATFARKRVYGAAIEPFRRRGYRWRFELPLFPGCAFVSPAIDERIASRQLAEIMARALAALDRKARVIIYSHYWQGIPLAGIACVLGAPCAAIYKQHRNALSELRRELRRNIHFTVQGPGVPYRLLA